MSRQSVITDVYLKIQSMLADSQSDTGRMTKMLDAFAHHYKYPLTAQLAIYAQRPDATAVASMDTWNRTMNRWIAPGSKSISLIVNSTGVPEIQRVFDVSDTKAPDGFLDGFRLEDYKWDYKQEHEESVLKALTASFKFSENTLSGVIDRVSEQLVDEYFNNNQEKVSRFIPFTTRNEFCKMAADSTAYIIRARCGLDKSFSDRHEPSKLPPEGFNMLCEAASMSAKEVLSKIELTINQNERKAEYGQEKPGTEVPRSDGEWTNLSGAGHRNPEVRNQQVGQDEMRLSGGTSGVDVQHDEPVRGIVGTPGAYQRDGGQAVRPDDGADGAPEPASGQQRGLFGLRPAHEPTPRNSRRNNPGGTNLSGRTGQLGLFDRPLSVDSAQALPVDSAQALPVSSEPAAPAQNKIPKPAAEVFNTQIIAQEIAPLAVGSTEPPITHNQKNYRILNMNLGEGAPGEGQKTKFRWNIQAIQTLKTIESENRPATLEEQNVLSRYVGWGGMPQAFDGDNPLWTREYAELRELLTESEYESARASTPNAHYTSPVVIKAMYDALERMGYQKGNILEPACGIGNFFGMLPESMKESKLYGIELDSVSARIAQKLYPNVKIQEKAFEKSELPNNAFNVVIGNVPFGSYKVRDDYIHDFFIKESLEKLSPGGVGALITSTGTADKQSPDLRRYIAEHAEIIGMTRLHNEAFLKNANTYVSTDIIFFRKRERKIDIDAVDKNSRDFIDLGYTANGVPINGYYVENPHMVLGEMVHENKMYCGERTACIPLENANLADQLDAALRSINAKFFSVSLDNAQEEMERRAIPANPDVKNYSFTVVDNSVYYRENSLMYPVENRIKVLERIKGMVALRDCTRKLIHYQLDNYSDDSISLKQAELGRLYDSFVRNHGHINSSANKQAFKEDAGYFLLTGLENKDKDGNITGKADIFTKRTIASKQVVTSAGTSNEALIVSLAEKNGTVDLAFMSKLTGFSHEKIISDLDGVIFHNPAKWNGLDLHIGWETSDEYLSGNVREKLNTAKGFANNDNKFEINVKALEKVQPRDLDFCEIAVRLGSTWIDKKYVEQFLKETLELPYYSRPLVQYSDLTGKWEVSALLGSNSVLNIVTYGTVRMNAFEIIEETLNLRDVRVYDTHKNDKGSVVSVLNQEETTKAKQKQALLKEKFSRWIFQDPDRTREITKFYNEKFNSITSRAYDGSHLNFPGMNPEHKLRPHQCNAVARCLYGNNTLLAHEVGTGKTFIFITAAMEKKRLGLCRKTLVSVPKHLTKQIANDFIKLYPGANILVASAKDFTEENRKRFCAKIATGDYDAIIIGHTQLERIPLSRDRQERLIKQEIKTITDNLSELNNGYRHERQKNRFTIKQMEITKKSLEAKIEKLLNEEKKDNVITFEELGVDSIVVDEAHYFKNLYFHTKMRGNIKGISHADAQKTIDFLFKTQYINEITSEKGIILATGTPVSNSIVELHAMLRYMAPELLEKLNIETFDKFSSTFFDTETNLEPAPEGGGHQMVTRLLPRNAPEVVQLFKQIADIQTAEGLGIERPEAERITVVSNRTDIQAELINELAKRAGRIRSGAVKKEEDNMLLITNEGRKIGLDQRLINPLLPDDPESKVNSCVRTVLTILRETEKDKSTQLIFCDMSTPCDGFNIYDDMKQKFLFQGVLNEEVAFIHDAATEEQKEKLFERVRNGEIRVLLGSTDKMGAGTNVQDKLIALHHLSCPYRPSDLAQRDGRGERQGNTNEKIRIFYYVTKDTFDQYLYHLIKTKWDMIRKIITDKVPEQRHYDSLDDISVTYAQVQAVATGNPKIKEYVELEIEIDRLKILERGYKQQIWLLQSKIDLEMPRSIAYLEKYIEDLKIDIARLENGTDDKKFSPMTIENTLFYEKQKAGQAIIDLCQRFFFNHKNAGSSEPVQIGKYRGFDLYLSFHAFDKSFKASFRGEGGRLYDTALGTDVYGNIIRLDNLLDGIPKRLESVYQSLEKARNELESARLEIEKTSPHAEMLEAAIRRYEKIGAELNMDKSENADPDSQEGLQQTDMPETSIGVDCVLVAASEQLYAPDIRDGSTGNVAMREIKERINVYNNGVDDDRIIVGTIPDYETAETGKDNGMGF